jgi:hypothetical protein
MSVNPTPTTCTESVTFKPTAPGVREGAVVLLDSANNVLGTTYLSGTGVGGLGVLVPGNVLPVAGNGDFENVVDGILATKSELFLPSGVTLDGAGNLYIADTLHNRIRMVCASTTSVIIAGTSCPIPGTGIIMTIAGNGAAGYGGDGGPASAATLSSPSSVALDGAGNLYIADAGNNVIRMISSATGKIATVAGNGTAGYGGDRDLATSASTELNDPHGVTFDAYGNLYIADTYNQRIRMVAVPVPPAIAGIITTVAGNGTAGYNPTDDGGVATAAELNFPDAVAFDVLGNWYIADSQNNRIREVAATTSDISTFAGNGTAGYAGDNQLATSNTVELDAPTSVAADAAGNVYIADTQNNAIRKVSWSSGMISTISLNGAGEYFFGGVFAPVSIYGPTGLFLDGSANLYFADSLNNAVREIQSNFVALDFTNSPIVQGSKSETLPQTVENDGNAELDLTLPGISVDTNDPYGFVNAALATPPTTCPTDSNPFLAAVDDTCVIGAVFAPNSLLGLSSSERLTPYITVGTSGDTVNSPLNIELVGIGTPLNSTTVTLTSSLNPSDLGENVTFTATVTSSAGTPTGTVSFYDNDGLTPLQTGVALSGGSATYTTFTLSLASHTILASYSGDSTHLSNTGTLVQNVDIIPTITSLVSSTIGTGADQQLALVATVVNNPIGGIGTPLAALYIPTGTVTFYLNSITGQELGVATLSGGVATLIPESLSAGSNTIVAVYSGDTDHLSSSSTLTTVNNSTAFTLTVTPDNPSVATTQNTTVTVTLTSLNGFTDTIGLGCGSLPAGVNCHFSSLSTTLAADGTQTVTLTIDTNNPLGGGASAMNRHPGMERRAVSLAGLFLPLSVLFGCIFWRFRRRYALAMTMSLVLLLGAATQFMTGCSGFSQSSASPGTYVIQVTGVGANSSITRYENVTLTISK